MAAVTDHGYAQVNGVDMYWESWGEGDSGARGGIPLLLVHGGYGLTSDFDDLRAGLAPLTGRRVIAIELEGHGHTRSAGRPFLWETFADDIAGVVRQLGLESVDLLGYSLGGEASLRCAIQHPSVVRRLALVSVGHRRDAWFPEIRAAWDQMTAATLFGMLQQSPLYAPWQKVAPDPESFPALIDSTGQVLRQPYDWSDEVRKLPMPVLLVYGDADSIPPDAAGEFFGLLGGGQRDAGWDGSGLGKSRLAILPGVTHYDIIRSPALPGIVSQFLA